MDLKNLLLCTFLGASMLGHAEQKTVNVATPGSLSTLIEATDAATELKLTGQIDKRDLDYVNSSLLNVKSLDLKEVTIAACVVNGEDYSANELPDSVFYKNEHLDKVVLPASITEIGESAFDNALISACDFAACTKLKTIEDHAFEFCKNLADINLSGLTALETIEEYAFDQTHTSSINLEGCSSLKTLEERAFVQSYFCTSVNLKGCTSLTFIGNRAFLNIGKYINDGKNGVTAESFHIDLSPCTALETIDESGFQSGKMTSITLPASLKEVKAKAFNLTTKVTAITFLGTTPPTLGTTAFTSKEMTSEDVTVLVPSGSEEAYRAAGFENAKGTDLTAIRQVVTSPSAASRLFDLQGREVAVPQRGLYIREGKKILVK
ncbi:MAG: leucine-rich repeat domain-containing protein [Prevotella sp.]|nr:leucine-rich repeat domain-containing protein [Prevotella sp.]